jgi:hypothetical protein
MNMVEELRELLEITTPERWSIYEESSGHAMVVDCQDVSVCRVYQQPDDTWRALDTARLISRVKNNLPALLEAAEALEAIRARINGEFDNPALLARGLLRERCEDDLLQFCNEALEKLK